MGPKRRRRGKDAPARVFKPLTTLQRMRETAIHESGLSKRAIAEKMSELVDRTGDERWGHRGEVSPATVTALVRDTFYSERMARAFAQVVGRSTSLLFPHGSDGPRLREQ